MSKLIVTPRGSIQTPCFIPVTTFGPAYPLDNLIRPYLSRFAQAVMVAAFYARQMPEQYRSDLPMCVDSGGFASLFDNARIDWSQADGFGSIVISGDNGLERTSAEDVLRLQEKLSDVGYTLDAIVTPDTPAEDARRRIDFTVRNAQWARTHRPAGPMQLFASLQCTDVGSARESAQEYARLRFDGVAIGGMVPRLKNIQSVLDIVTAVREEVGDAMPIHVFGVGKPELLSQVFAAGADMCDSSSYVKAAAEGRSWLREEVLASRPAATERMQFALENLSAACWQPVPATFPGIVGCPGFSSSN